MKKSLKIAILAMTFVLFSSSVIPPTIASAANVTETTISELKSNNKEFEKNWNSLTVEEQNSFLNVLKYSQVEDIETSKILDYFSFFMGSLDERRFEEIWVTLSSEEQDEFVESMGDFENISKANLVVSLQKFVDSLTINVIPSDLPDSEEATSEFVDQFSISNKEFFEYAKEEHNLDFEEILPEEDYEAALKQDALKQGGTYVKIYKVKGEKRYKIAINSALVKCWKYGGHAAIYALQAFCAVRGAPLDMSLSIAMHNQMSRINSKRGFIWIIGTKKRLHIISAYSQ